MGDHTGDASPFMGCSELVMVSPSTYGPVWFPCACAAAAL